MSETDDRLTRTIAVPSWMVYLLSALLTVLSSGAVATVCITVNWVFILSQEQGDLKRDLSAMQVKEADVVAALSSLNRAVADVSSDVKQLQRELDKLP